MEHLPTIYAAAVLLPLASFFAILLFARQLDRFAAWIATSAILGAAALSFLAFGLWINHSFPEPVHHGGHSAVHEEGDREQGTGDRGHGSGTGPMSKVQGPRSDANFGLSPANFVALVQEA